MGVTGDSGPEKDQKVGIKRGSDKDMNGKWQNYQHYLPQMPLVACFILLSSPRAWSRYLGEQCSYLKKYIGEKNIQKNTFYFSFLWWDVGQLKVLKSYTFSEFLQSVNIEGKILCKKQNSSLSKQRQGHFIIRIQELRTQTWKCMHVLERESNQS